MAKRNEKITVGIIGGKGKMGRIFANIFECAGCNVLIADLHTPLKNEKLAKMSDVVIICVPIAKTVDVIKKIVHEIKSSSLLMDITSIKGKSIPAMIESSCAVIGLHPMFNNTTIGPGQTIIINPARPRCWLHWVTNILKQNNFNLRSLSAQRHDKIMSLVQGLVHAAEMSFIHALKKNNIGITNLLSYSGPAPSLKILLASRILAQDPDLYSSIQLENPHTKNAQKIYLESLKELTDIVERGNEADFKKYFLDARSYLGDFQNIAMKETDWLIAQILEKNFQSGNFQRRNSQTKKLQTRRKSQVKSGRPEKIIAILGPPLTFTDLASEKIMSEKIKKIHPCEKIYFEHIEEVFQAVEHESAKWGIIPMENNLNGTVSDTLDGLFKHKVRIIFAFKFPIHHSLCVYPTADEKGITAVMSHPQTFYQCSRYLDGHFNRHFHKLEYIASPSTVTAMERLKRLKHENIAVIGSKEAAKKIGLKVLAENIENDRNNATTFIVIEKEGAGKKSFFLKQKFYKDKREHGNFRHFARATEEKWIKKRTSIVFYFSKDAPGTLSSVFQSFAVRGINLTKIESRPSKKICGDYLFFLDFDGTLEDTEVKKVLEEVKKQTAFLKILGNYDFFTAKKSICP